MRKVTSKTLDEIIRRLRNGEQVQCPLCEDGNLEPIGDYKSTHCFQCSGCGEKLNMDPVIKE